MRFEETNILSCCFLPGMSLPTLAILYQDAHDGRHVTSYVINVRANNKAAGTIARTTVEPGANLLVPVNAPYKGLVVIGEQSIVYLQPMNNPITTYMEATVIKAYEIIDSTRILLGDHQGRLYVLILLIGNQGVEGLHLEKLGVISSPTSLSYLNDGMLFVGSAYGDSQLVQLNTEKNDEGDYVNILDEMPNLGPITDFAVVDLEKQGQAQVITCSGAGTDGSLRIIQNGVGVNIQATLEIPGVKNVFSLRPSYASDNEDKLIVSFIEQTKVLKQIGDELHEIEAYSGYDLTRPTLATINTVEDKVVQITDNCVRLMEPFENGDLLDEYSTESGTHITIAATNSNRCAISTGEGTLIVLEYSTGKLVKQGLMKLDNEIACIHINQFPLEYKDDVIVVGFWTSMRAQLLSARDFNVIATIELGGDIIPRSIVLTEFEKELFLLIALGDGQLFNFQVDPLTFQLSNQKKVSIGTQPLNLNTFSANGNTHVFAASDRPTVIHSSNHKIRYSDVNLKDMSNITAFRNESFENCIAFTTSSDDQSFEMLHDYELKGFETGQSIANCSFDGGISDVYVVGTVTAIAGQEDVHEGRILVLHLTHDRKLSLLCSKQVEGSPYCIRQLGDKLVVAVNGTVIVYEWQNQSLNYICSLRSNTIIVDMAVNGNQIVVADLMRSVTKLEYNDSARTLQEVAFDFNPNWMTSIVLPDSDTIIGAEVGYNLFTMGHIRHNTVEGSGQLELLGEWHLGEYVNRFRHGSLVMSHSESPTTPQSILFGTINGVLGAMHGITADQYLLLSQVESNIIHVIGSIGNFDYSEYVAKL
ncbi:unnamed protein product [Umbelopsis sp. WA50703]